MICLECNKKAVYNYEGNTEPEYCYKHKKSLMIRKTLLSFEEIQYICIIL
jgi:hypothetical protein